MWWALAAAAIPYVMQQFQGHPDQPQAPGMVRPPDRSNYDSALLENAFNPHAELFQRASDVVNENVNRSLARQGLSGSSVGGALQANTQGVLAQKWLEDQTSRQRMALNEVNTNDLSRSNAMNQYANDQYQYGAAAYNRGNAWNASQTAGLAGMAGAGLNAYGQSQTNGRLDANAAAYQNAMAQMAAHYQGAPQYGTPGPGAGYAPGGADLYANYSQPATGMSASPNIGY